MTKPCVGVLKKRLGLALVDGVNLYLPPHSALIGTDEQ